ncbi:MAG: hypothetical protein WDO72_01920 [Pseudomonadota bacterium]
MRFVLPIVSLLALAACSEQGAPGIGGAAFDDQRLVAEVNGYPGFVAPIMSEEVSGSCPGSATQQFDKMFADFRESYTTNGEKPVELGTHQLQVSFASQVFVIAHGQNELVREQLPRAFYMEEMWVGIDQVDGNDVIVVSTRTRSTTGRYFVGLYSLAGEPLYRRVLSAGDVWDIEHSDAGIVVLGACSKRLLSVSGPNKSLERTRVE